MNNLRIVTLDLWRHRGMSFIIILALSLTIAISGILFRIGKLGNERFKSIVPAGDAIVGAKSGQIELLLGSLNLEGPYPNFIPIRLYGTLLNQGKVGFPDGDVNTALHRCIVPILFCGKIHNYRLIATTHAFLDQPDPSPKIKFATGTWAKSEGQIVLGATMAAKEKLSAGDDILIPAWTSNKLEEQFILPFKFKVTGVLAEMGNSWDRAAFTNLDQGRKILSTAMIKENSIWGKDVLHFLIIYLLPNSLEPLKSLIDQRTVAEVADVPEARKALQSLTGTGESMGYLVVIIVFLLGGLAMVSLLVGRFEVKTKQWAMLKAMGYMGQELYSLVIWEWTLLMSTAYLIGIALDFLFFPLIRKMFSENLPPSEFFESPIWQSWPVWFSAGAITFFCLSLQFLIFQKWPARKYLQLLS